MVKKIIVLYPHTSATKDIMVRNFEQLLDKNKYKFSYIPFNYFDNAKEFIDSDVVIGVKGVASAQYVNVIKKYNNKLFIYLLDDDILSYYKLADKGFEQFYEYRPGTEWYRNTIETIKMSNIVLATSKEIINSVKQHNKNIIHIPTNVLEKYIKKIDLDGKNVIKIAHIGGSARKKEYNLIWEDLVKISNKYGEKVEFCFYGWEPPRKNEITNSKICFFSYNENYYDYIEMIKKEKISILLSPLIDEGSKISKSNVKLIDACISNSIGIYSDSSVYSEIIHMEHGIKISNGIDNWFDGIELAINLSNEKRNEILNNAKNLVLNNYLTEKYLIFFEEMLNGKSFY